MIKIHIPEGVIFSTLEDARRLLKKLTSSASNMPLFVSDELPHYADGLKELFYTVVQPEPTGLPGRPRSPEKVINDSLGYATVHKTRENGRIVKVEKNVLFTARKNVLK